MRTCITCGVPFEGRYCRICARASSAKWRMANREKERARIAKYAATHAEKIKAKNNRRRKENLRRFADYQAQWRSAHPEKAKAVILKWRQKNADKVKKMRNEWRASHPHFSRVQQHNRRARKRVNGGRLSKGVSDKLFKLQHGKCACCGEPLGENYQLDHKTPIALGGVNEDWNMQLLTERCNKQKGWKHPISFMQSRGFLL